MQTRAFVASTKQKCAQKQRGMRTRSGDCASKRASPRPAYQSSASDKFGDSRKDNRCREPRRSPDSLRLMGCRRTSTFQSWQNGAPEELRSSGPRRDEGRSKMPWRASEVCSHRPLSALLRQPARPRKRGRAASGPVEGELGSRGGRSANQRHRRSFVTPARNRSGSPSNESTTKGPLDRS